MKTRHVRLFADEHGLARFEDLETELIPGFAVPPAEPLHTAPFLPGDGGIFWIGAPSDWKGGAPHPAPRRMVFVTVRGEYEVTVADGIARRFPVGSVLIVEDTVGDGHSTRITSDEDTVAFVVGLPSA